MQNPDTSERPGHPSWSRRRKRRAAIAAVCGAILTGGLVGAGPAAAAAPEPLGEGTYTFTTGGGEAMDVPGRSLDNGTALVTWAVNGDDNQKFQVRPAGGEYVTLVPQHTLAEGEAHRKCLDVRGGSSDPGADIIQYECHGGDNQKFRAVPSGSGYALQAKHSGDFIGVADGNVVQSASPFVWAAQKTDFSQTLDTSTISVPGKSTVADSRPEYRCPAGWHFRVNPYANVADYEAAYGDGVVPLAGQSIGSFNFFYGVTPAAQYLATVNVYLKPGGAQAVVSYWNNDATAHQGQVRLHCDTD
ncbi:RICIN domain-containing protein [Streptomyces sp. TRM64462]|uniref:RICIN domain-containing protein n=1 Tax=Streptomyces sp. TRM64462 TaxID=2741726 RepID=UPI001586E13F|nr:RICIN domain-containing protein [Streptomyces sp. TRM64462]